MSSLRKRRSRLVRQPSGKPVLVTPRDVAIFRLLNRYRYLRSTFLHAFFDADRTRFIRRLGQLYHDGGYIDRPKRQYAYANALYLPAVYEIGEPARQVLKYHGGEPLKADRKAGSSGEARNFAHALMICDILASIEIGCLRSGAVPSEDDDEMTADGLVGGHSASGYRFFRPGVRFITQEEIIARAPCCNFENPLRIPINDDLKGVTPDGVFGLQYASGYRFFALEADRGTEPISRATLTQTSYRKKFLQYKEVLARGSYKTHFGTSSLYVLHVTVSEERKEKLMEALKRITGGRGSPVSLFKVMKGDWMTAPPADGHMFSEPWARAGYPPFRIDQG
jgi:hypothetical protein